MLEATFISGLLSNEKLSYLLKLVTILCSSEKCLVINLLLISSARFVSSLKWYNNGCQT